MGPSMAAVRGPCTSSLSPSTSQHGCTSHPSSSYASPIPSSSFSRSTLISKDRRVPQLSSRKCKVTIAVLVDPQVKSKTSCTSTSLLEQSETRLTDSRLLELIAANDLQTSVDVASPVASSSRAAKKTPTMGLADTGLESTLEHRLWVAFGGLAVTGMMTKALSVCNSSEEFLQVAVGVVAGYVLSDLGTGFYHWGVDNYGDAKTPVFGAQIDAFQGHHQRPWTITKREFANNIHAIARPAGLFLCPFLLLPSQPFVDSFLGIFLGCVVMSQQFHAWSHMKKSQLPDSIIALQDAGVLVSRKMHGAHHKPPYDVNYCIVSGVWNPALEKSQVFKRLERFIYAKWGVAPRAWSETSEEWLQAGTYFEDGSDLDSSQSS